ncbi:hypothetical protein [Parasedimentitalea psychrophila]|uniref:Uncharacterized protein n=1 Tax=Parasedimentitalea psychrophila TaxID=2997337 RepID=A0A9Y2L1J3_9RHOB|nr:hypothetical protein [Parasedimentitalea psychrophila]WIY27065.1 hypothetical protein QPJ95_09180 [Parasedimentitalea psychrophila]
MLAPKTQPAQHRNGANSARRRANASLSMSYRGVSLYCQITLPKRNTAASQFTSAAIAQLQPMPGSRSGQPDLRLVGQLRQRH